MGVVPVEMWESLTSTTILKKHLLPDSGGPGASRGGLGQEVHFRNDTGEPMTLFCMAARTEFPALGLLGGGAGGKRRMMLEGEAVHPKGTHRLAPGAHFTMREAGGGGFGAAAEREPEFVRVDLERGFVTPEGAEGDYGIDADP